MAQLSKARELREQRKKLVVQAQDLANKPDNTKEDRASAQTMLNDADELKTQIDLLERADVASNEFTDRTPPPAAQPGTENGTKDTKEQRTAAHAKAFRSYLQHGRDEMPAEERKLLTEFRDMGTGGGNALQGTGGGYFVPVGFVNEYEEAMKYFGPMLAGDGTGRDGYPTILPTLSGQPLPYPTSNDTGVTGELIGEGVQVTSNDVTLGNVTFGAYKYSTKMVKVSMELLNDSAFDIESFLKQQFAIRVGRILNTHTTTGSGVSQPNGIVTAAALGATAVGSSGNDGTSASTNTIGSDDLVTLEHSVDILYRNGAKFMMHDATLRQIKTLKDKYGRPLWLPGLAAKEPDTINGYGFLINNDMDQLQSTGPNSPPTVKKTVLFGAISKYMIRRVKELSVLRLVERFADFGQVAFVGFARYDGQLLDAGGAPVKYLKNSY
jgi:HK97 family phage major capsid protein